MFTVNFVTSKSDQNNWSGAAAHHPDDSRLFAQRGEMLSVLALSSPAKTDLNTIGQMLLDEIQEKYFYEDKFKNPLEQLEFAVSAMSKRIDLVLEHEPQLVEQGLDLQISLVIIRDNIAYLGVIGEAKTILLRGVKSIQLDQHLNDPTGRDFLRIGSIKLSPESDIVIIMSDSAHSQLTNESIIGLAYDLDISKIAVDNVPASSVAIIADSELVERLVAQQVQETEIEQAEDEIEVLDSEDGEIIPEPETNNEIDIDSLLDEEQFDDGIDSPQIKTVIANKPVPEKRSRVNRTDLRARAESLLALAKIRLAALQTRLEIATVGLRTRLAKYKLPEKIKHQFNRFKQSLNLPADRRQAKTYQVVLANITTRVKSLYTLAQRTIRKQLGNRDSFKRGSKNSRIPITQNWKVIAALAVIVLIILYLIISNAVENNRQNSLRDQAQKTHSDYETKLGKIENDVLALQIGTGREADKATKVNEIQAEIVNLNKLNFAQINNRQDLEKKRKDLIDLYQAQIDTLRGVIKIENEQLIADLGVSFQNVNASDIEYLNDNVYVSDKENSVIYKIPAQANATPVQFAKSDLVQPNTIAADTRGDLIVMDEDQNNVIATVNLTDGSVVKHVGGLGPSNAGLPNNVKAYKIGEQDRLYWIDNASNEIKWVGRSPVGGYGTEPNVRRKDTNFATAVDIDVDGRIYVLSPERGILRYNGSSNGQLVQDNYTLSGLFEDDSLTNMSGFVVTSKYIYVADPANRRIVVVEKARNGNNAGFMDVVAQLVYRGQDSAWSDLKDLVYDSKTKMLYVLAGLKVYRVPGYES